MSDRTDEELELLRERAYGPNADIGDDPSALHRLRQLEGYAASCSEPDEEERHLPLPYQGGVTGPVGADAGRTTPSDDSSGSRKALRRPPLIGIAVALVAATAIVVTSVITAALIRAESPYVDAQYVTSLPVEDDAAWPSSLGEPLPGNQRYADFLGYTVFFSETAFSDSAAGRECLSIVTPDNPERDPAVGAVVTSCGAGAFRPATTVVVNENSPQSVRDVYSVGTALQFAQNGSSVDVYADTP